MFYHPRGYWYLGSTSNPSLSFLGDESLAGPLLVGLTLNGFGRFDREIEDNVFDNGLGFGFNLLVYVFEETGEGTEHGAIGGFDLRIIFREDLQGFLDGRLETVALGEDLFDGGGEAGGGVHVVVGGGVAHCLNILKDLRGKLNGKSEPGRRGNRLLRRGRG